MLLLFLLLCIIDDEASTFSINAMHNHNNDTALMSAWPPEGQHCLSRHHNHNHASKCNVVVG